MKITVENYEIGSSKKNVSILPSINFLSLVSKYYIYNIVSNIISVLFLFGLVAKFHAHTNKS
jgi:hypothetical protein